jgi:hypothetical protein
MQHVMQKLYHRQIALQRGYALNWLLEAVLEAVPVHLRYQQEQFHIRAQHLHQQN